MKILIVIVLVAVLVALASAGAMMLRKNDGDSGARGLVDRALSLHSAGLVHGLDPAHRDSDLGLSRRFVEKQKTPLTRRFSCRGLQTPA